MSYIATYSYDPTATGPLANIYALRRLMGDTSVEGMSPGTPRAQQTAIFSDQEYLAFLDDVGGDVTYAWARALLSVASNRAAMAVMVNLAGGGSVDFRALSTELRNLSKDVMDNYANIFFESYSEEAYGDFGLRRIFANDVLREQV